MLASLRFNLLICFLVMLPILVSHGQTGPKNKHSRATVIRKDTALVLVPVVVHTASGTHVGNLRREDFQVWDNGTKQAIQSFDEIVASPGKSPVKSAGEYSNYIDASAQRLMIILLDLVNTPYIGQQYAREELLKALESTLNTDEPRALLTLTRSGIRVVHDFTSDPAVLAEALRKTRGIGGGLDTADTAQVATDIARLQAFATPLDMEWDMAVRERWVVESTLSSLNQLAAAFAGVPGRKALIWASAGFPFPSDIENQYFSHDRWSGRSSPATMSLTEAAQSLEKTIRLFNSANIAIYSVDVRGLVNESYRDATIRGDASSFFNWIRTHREDSTTTLAYMARETGGLAFVGISDVGQGMRDALEDSRSYYLLGYYIDHLHAAPGWHKLKVKVGHSTADLRWRAGFILADRTESLAAKNRETEQALSSPLNYTALPFTVSIGDTIDRGHRKRVSFVLRVAPAGFEIDRSDNNHAEFEVIAAVVNSQGHITATRPETVVLHLKPQSLEKVTNSGFEYRSSFEVEPGTYTARFLVRDLLSGRFGTVSAPLTVSP